MWFVPYHVWEVVHFSLSKKCSLCLILCIGLKFAMCLGCPCYRKLYINVKYSIIVYYYSMHGERLWDVLFAVHGAWCVAMLIRRPALCLATAHRTSHILKKLDKGDGSLHASPKHCLCCAFFMQLWTEALISAQRTASPAFAFHHHCLVPHHWNYPVGLQSKVTAYEFLVSCIYIYM